MGATALEIEETEKSPLQDAIQQAQASEPVVIAIEDEPDLRDEESELDDIDLQVESREWHVAGKVLVQRGRGGPVEEVDFDRVYTQKPLGYIAMMQFTGMLGDKIVEVMSGPDGLTIDGAFNNPDIIASAGALFAREDFSNVDVFLKGFARIASYVPELIADAQCIWLQIPLHERASVKQIWARSPEDGGLSMAEGEEMLERFLLQNYGELDDFFVERLPRQLALARKLRARRARSRRSKR